MIAIQSCAVSGIYMYRVLFRLPKYARSLCHMILPGFYSLILRSLSADGTIHSVHLIPFGKPHEIWGRPKISKFYRGKFPNHNSPSADQGMVSTKCEAALLSPMTRSDIPRQVHQQKRSSFGLGWSRLVLEPRKSFCNMVADTTVSTSSSLQSGCASQGWAANRTFSWSSTLAISELWLCKDKVGLAAVCSSRSSKDFFCRL